MFRFRRRANTETPPRAYLDGVPQAVERGAYVLSDVKEIKPRRHVHRAEYPSACTGCEHLGWSPRRVDEPGFWIARAKARDAAVLAPRHTHSPLPDRGGFITGCQACQEDWDSDE